MQSEMSPSRRAVLDALMAAGEPQSLDGLFTAGVAGLSRAGIYRQLLGMVEEGLVERHGARQDARYLPRASLKVEWTVHTRLGMVQEERWQRHEWHCDGAIDWRFPLVSRVPDILSRRTLWRFFSEAHARGYLTPWLLDMSEPRDGESLSTRIHREEYYGELRDPRDPSGFMFCVYGSTARGEAREDSDLDLLLIGPYEEGTDGTPFLWEIPFGDLAAEMSLGSPRPIHFTSYTLDQFWNTAPWFRRAVLESAITVYTSKPGGDYVEAWRQADDE